MAATRDDAPLLNPPPAPPEWTVMQHKKYRSIWQALDKSDQRIPATVKKEDLWEALKLYHGVMELVEPKEHPHKKRATPEPDNKKRRVE